MPPFDGHKCKFVKGIFGAVKLKIGSGFSFQNTVLLFVSCKCWLSYVVVIDLTTGTTMELIPDIVKLKLVLPYCVYKQNKEYPISPLFLSSSLYLTKWKKFLWQMNNKVSLFCCNLLMYHTVNMLPACNVLQICCQILLCDLTEFYIHSNIYLL